MPAGLHMAPDYMGDALSVPFIVSWYILKQQIVLFARFDWLLSQ